MPANIEAAPVLPAAAAVEFSRCPNCDGLHVVLFNDADQPAYSAAMETDTWAQLLFEDVDFRVAFAALLLADPEARASLAKRLRPN